DLAEKKGTLPRDVIAELGQLGVLGMTIPETDGGLGASAVAFALVLEELSAAWPSLAVGVAVNSGIVAGSIVRSATDEQRKRWLPKLMDGTGLGAFALTEPTSGSDAASLRTTARPEGNGWRIDGRKQFITNARYAPFAIVLARAYAKERRQFGRPIADFEGLRFRIAKAESDLAAARLLALRAAWLRDRGRPFTREAAMAKLYASEMAQRATHAAVQILGGNG